MRGEFFALLSGLNGDQALRAAGELAELLDRAGGRHPAAEPEGKNGAEIFAVPEGAAGAGGVAKLLGRLGLPASGFYTGKRRTRQAGALALKLKDVLEAQARGDADPAAGAEAPEGRAALTRVRAGYRGGKTSAGGGQTAAPDFPEGDLGAANREYRLSSPPEGSITAEIEAGETEAAAHGGGWREMSRISEFFRRDARRYDREFQ